MSEHLPHNSGEKFESISEQDLSSLKEQERRKNETLNENTEKPKKDIEEIRSSANKEAKSTEQILREASQDSPREENEPALINYEIKEIAYQRLLKRTRRHLPAYSRTMSKIIHQPVVDTASEAISKTVGRPSGIIGGALLSLIGTSIYYYLARHYGYSYNSFVFLILMVAGFAFGWSIEILYKLLKKFTKK